MRWSDFDACVRAAVEFVDVDTARDVALAVLEDVEAKQLSLTTQQLKWRARWRAHDSLRRPGVPLAVFKFDVNMDDFIGPAPSPEEELEAKQLEATLTELLGPDAMDFLAQCSAEGPARIAAELGWPDERVRKQLSRLRKRAKEALE